MMPNVYGAQAPEQGGHPPEQPSRPAAKAKPTGNVINDTAAVENTVRGSQLGLPLVPVYDDDANRISNSYKTLGAEHLAAKSRAAPIRFRISLICACNSDDYPHLRLSQLPSEYIDMLLFMCAKIRPDSKPSDLGASTKGAMRQAVRAQYEVRRQRGRARFEEIAEDFSNLPQLAVRDGYPLQLCTPETRKYLSATGVAHFQGAGAQADPDQQQGTSTDILSLSSSSSGSRAPPASTQATGGRIIALCDGLPQSPAKVGSARVPALLAKPPLPVPGAGVGLKVTDADAGSAGQPPAEDVGGNAEAVAEPPPKRPRLVLPKLNLPCLSNQNLETAALRRRRDAAVGAEDGDEPLEAHDVD